jgi:hypothetical protein
MNKTIKQVVEPCHPKNLGDSYNTQDLLIRAVNCPSKVYEGEEFYREWSDREYIYKRWEAAREIMNRNVKPVEFGTKAMKEMIRICPSPDSWCGSCSVEEFMEFLTALADPSMVKKHGQPIGGRIVRFTNVSNGYPCYAIDVFHSPHGVESLKGRTLGRGKGLQGRQDVFGCGATESV